MLTSLIDLAGCLLLVAAVVVLVWPLSVAGALASGGVALLVLSWLVDLVGRRKGASS